MKKCCVCKDYLLESSFHAHHGMTDGLQPACKNCGRSTNRRRDARIRAGEVTLAARQVPDKKMCIRCSLIKEKSEFNVYKKGKDGLNPWCKECRKQYNREWTKRTKFKEPPRYQKRKAEGYYERKRLARYGLTPETFKELFAFQGNKCGICGNTESGNGRAWAIDHDHKCCPPERACDKCRRGVLCHGCNTGMGGLGDNAELLFKAILYLGKPPAQEIVQKTDKAPEPCRECGQVGFHKCPAIPGRP